MPSQWQTTPHIVQEYRTPLAVLMCFRACPPLRQVYFTCSSQRKNQAHAYTLGNDLSTTSTVFEPPQLCCHV